MLDRDEMAELARRHAALEADPDLSSGVGPAIDAVLATLNDDPIYELLPRGVSFHGRDAARRYYEHFFTTFQPTVVGGEMVSEYVGAHGLCLEYVIATRGAGGGVERHSIISVLTFGEELLSGERVYGSDAFLRQLFGPLWEDAS